MHCGAATNCGLDMLDEFSAVKIDHKKPETPPRPPHPPGASVAEDDVLSEDDFAKQLQAGMADLLGELENSVCEGHYHGD